MGIDIHAQKALRDLSHFVIEVEALGRVSHSSGWRVRPIWMEPDAQHNTGQLARRRTGVVGRGYERRETGARSTAR